MLPVVDLIADSATKSFNGQCNTGANLSLSVTVGVTQSFTLNVTPSRDLNLDLKVTYSKRSRNGNLVLTRRP